MYYTTLFCLVIQIPKFFDPSWPLFLLAPSFLHDIVWLTLSGAFCMIFVIIIERFNRQLKCNSELTNRKLVPTCKEYTHYIVLCYIQLRELQYLFV